MSKLSYETIRTHGLATVEGWYNAGWIDLYTFCRYKLEWRWTAFRHTLEQERAYAKLGRKRFWRRIDRARVRCGFEPYGIGQED